MLSKSRYRWRRINASFWFAPACLILAAILLAAALLVLDSRYQLPWFRERDSFLYLSSDGSRQLLAVIAGSMISVASLVFSMTLVTLQLASSQFGPRLITRFMGDKVNQVALGTFVATFIYALLVLRWIEGGETSFVPHLSVLGAFVLTVISLGWLIYFIHHVAETIQADTVIADVTAELGRAIAGRFPQADLPEPQVIRSALPNVSPPEPCSVIAFAEDGYVQIVHIPTLLDLAEEREVVIDVLARPGLFAVPGMPAFEVRPVTRLDDDFRAKALGALVMSYRRTPTQDIEFGFSSLVSIGLRALSPAMNDPITAATCIDRLTAGIVQVMRAPPPPQQITNAEGRIRLVVHPATLADLITAVYEELGGAASGHPSVLFRLIGSLTILARLARIDPDRDALRGQADRFARLCASSLNDECDRERASRRLDELRSLLAV